MNIDRNNFKDNYQKIIQLIQSCDFISFDCEFSGLATERFSKIRKYDSDEDIYQKLKHAVQNYHLLQIGLCIYTFCKVQKKYIAYPYNIYLNPVYTTSSESIKKQMIQLECFNFMAVNGLDFNKLYSSGLSYIKLAQKEKILENSKYQQNHGIALSKANRDALEAIVKQIQEYDQDNNTKEIIIECKSQYVCTKILKKQIGQAIYSCKNVNVEKGQTNTQLIIRKKKPTQNQNFKCKKALDAEDDESNNNNGTEEAKQNQDVDGDSNPSHTSSEIDLLGFSLIVEAIINSKRPIIGHYMGYDLFYFFDHFVDVLPNTFVEFVEKVNKYFPYIIDTKVLARKLQNKVKKLPLHLEGLYKAVAKDEKCLKRHHNTVLTNDPQFSKYTKEGQLHEAGFDSYITGASFIGMCYFEKFEQEKEKQLKDVPQRTKKGKVVQEYQEKHDQILKEVMETFIDPNFAKENLNHIFLQGGTFYFNHEFQVARDSFDINHNKEFLNNTLFIKFDPQLSFQNLADHFSQFGDAEISIVDTNLAYVEYEQFELFEGIEDKLDHIIPLLKNDKIEISKYVDRKRFTAFSYFN
ncbi:hypothetical protein ABPG72_017241 [Tetrahymena utriculariae]